MDVTRTAVITRESLSTDDGQFGRYRSDSGLELLTGEDPDLGNQPNVSCVPKGRYLCLWQWSQSHGKNVYHLQNVPGRTNCELHSGNLCGNKLKGEESDVEGCILFGLDFALFGIGFQAGKHPALKHPQRGVTSSVAAILQMEADMIDRTTKEQMPFWLTIV